MIYYKYGENGHVQYDWSHNIDHKIYQFFYQLVRPTNTEQLDILENELKNIFDVVFKDVNNIEKYNEQIMLLYKMVGHTRDIIYGKGERLLTYMLTFIWSLVDERLAYLLIDLMVKSPNIKDNIQGYGSWSDIKRFSQYIYDRTNKLDHNLINYMVNIANKQLKIDKQNMLNNNPISLAAKWLPRKSKNNKKYDWLHEKLAYNMFSHYFKNIPKNKIYKAEKKAEMNYRKLLSSLNNYLGTVETKLNNNWKDIDFNKIPSLALNKYYNSLLNINKTNNIKYNTCDRIECSELFKKHIDNNNKLNASKLSIYTLIKDIINNKLWYVSKNNHKRKLIIQQWKEYNKYNHNTYNNFIPILDVSYENDDMNSIKLFTAIGIGIKISEYNSEDFKNRLILFGSKSKWIVFNQKMDLIDKVFLIYSNIIGTNPNFYSSCQLILDTAFRDNIHPKHLQNITLIILSNMQVDNNCPAFLYRRTNSLYDNIVMMFENIGNNTIYRKPYPIPKIIFWNLDITDGFPCHPTDYNCSMLSGYNENIIQISLDNLKKNNTYNTKTNTPRLVIKKILSHHRYYPLEKYINTIIN